MKNTSNVKVFSGSFQAVPSPLQTIMYLTLEKETSVD